MKLCIGYLPINESGYQSLMVEHLIMSDWKERANKRRDVRNTKVPDPVRNISPKPSSKDTKKWCRGKTGKEHKPVCMKYRDVKQVNSGVHYGGSWRLLVCTECGKELDTYYGFRKQKPDWVDK